MTNFILISVIINFTFCLFFDKLSLKINIFVGALYDKVYLSALKKLIIFISLIIFSLIDQNIIIKFIYFELSNQKIILNEMGIFFSIMSIFYFMNALNMYDGINIQTPLYLILLFVFLIFKEQSFVVFLIIPSIFFLFLNFKGKCFLGNSGSYFLGYLISIILIQINQSNPNLLTSEEILILLSLPCIELCRLFFDRIIKNKNPFNADTNHIHHFLSKDFNNLTTSLITNGFIFIPLVISQFTNYKMIIFILQLGLYFLLIFKLKKKFFNL